jgi:hypothetical protein
MLAAQCGPFLFASRTGRRVRFCRSTAGGGTCRTATVSGQAPRRDRIRAVAAISSRPPSAGFHRGWRRAGPLVPGLPGKRGPGRNALAMSARPVTWNVSSPIGRRPQSASRSASAGARQQSPLHPPPARPSILDAGAARGARARSRSCHTRSQQQSGIPTGQAPASIFQTQRQGQATSAGGAAPSFIYPRASRR